MTNLALLTLIGFALFMSRGIMGPVNSLYVASLGASYTAIGVLDTVTSLTVVVLSYFWGRLSDRLGQRKILMVLGLAALGASYGLMALVPSYAYLFPLRVLAAAAQAAYGTANLALVGDLLERHAPGRGRSMGTFRGVSSLGFGLTALVSGSVADRLSLRVPFGLAALFAVLAAVLAAKVKESQPQLRGLSGHLAPGPDAGLAGDPPRCASSGNPEVAMKRSPATECLSSASLDGLGVHRGTRSSLPLSPLLLSAFLWSLVTGAVYAVWANYMVDGLHYSSAEMSALWALASLTELPLMILSGWLSDRVGRLVMLSLAFLAWTGVFAGYVLLPRMPWIVFVQLLRGFAYSAFTATAMTYAAEARATSQRGRVSGLYGSAGATGAILGSSMGGLLAQFTGFKVMIATNAVLVFGGAVYLAIVARKGRAVRA